MTNNSVVVAIKWRQERKRCLNFYCSVGNIFARSRTVHDNYKWKCVYVCACFVNDSLSSFVWVCVSVNEVVVLVTPPSLWLKSPHILVAIAFQLNRGKNADGRRHYQKWKIDRRRKKKRQKKKKKLKKREEGAEVLKDHTLSHQTGTVIGASVRV